MTHRRALTIAATALALTASLPSASSTWTLGYGTTLQQSNLTTITTGTDLTIGLLTWNSTDNNAPPIIDGVLIDLQPLDGTTPTTWAAYNWSNLNVTISGGPTTTAHVYITGLLVQTYTVLNLIGNPSFNVLGPTISFDIPAGDENITIIPSTPVLSGPRIMLEAAYSPDNYTINTIVAIQDADGSGLTSQAGLLTMTAIDPTGTTNGTFNLTETSTRGIYSGAYNLTLHPRLGNWLITAQYLTLTAGWQVRVDHPISLGDSDSVQLTTAYDNWLPTLFWGGLLLFFAWNNIWFPAFITLLNCIDNLLETYGGGHNILNTPARFMLLIIAIVLHILITKGLQAWRERNGSTNT